MSAQQLMVPMEALEEANAMIGRLAARLAMEIAARYEPNDLYYFNSALKAYIAEMKIVNEARALIAGVSQ